MYYCTCHTCDEEDTFPDREGAQAEFNEHARQQHEVVLRRAGSRSEAVISDSRRTAETSEPAKRPPEAEDGGAVDG